MLAYRYFEAGTNEPLRRCPQCNHALIEEGSVCLALSVGGRVVEVNARLDEQGWLVDTADSAVARGHHAGSYCGGCGALLLDMADEDQSEG